tara:strand:+ start:595 stop:747 length:153 start_codon:yes stop_codon:yes gene_type:complete
MSKKESEEEDITKYTEGTRMDDAYYFLPEWMWPQSKHRKKPKKEKDNETE